MERSRPQYPVLCPAITDFIHSQLGNVPEDLSADDIRNLLSILARVPQIESESDRFRSDHKFSFSPPSFRTHHSPSQAAVADQQNSNSNTHLGLGDESPDPPRPVLADNDGRGPVKGILNKYRADRIVFIAFWDLRDAQRAKRAVDAGLGETLRGSGSSDDERTKLYCEYVAPGELKHVNSLLSSPSSVPHHLLIVFGVFSFYLYRWVSTLSLTSS